MKLNKLFIIVTLLFFYKIIIAQKLPNLNKESDSLSNYTYTQLEDKFYENEFTDLEKAKVYVLNYYLRSRKSSNPIERSHGYRMMSYISEKDEAILYSDSIIQITKNSDHKYFPTLGYLLKGYYYYQYGDHQKSLDNYLLAYPYALQKNNFEDKLQIQNMIANLKDRWGAYDEALVMYKKSLSEIKKQKDYLTKFQDPYFSGLFNLGISYIRNKKIDSALITIKQGIKQSLKIKNKACYNMFVLSSGIANYEIKNYNEALDSINKSIHYVNQLNMSIGYYHLGDIYYKMKEEKKSLLALNKMDSIFKETNNEFPQLIKGYELLMEHYKNKQNLKKQLEYIQKIMHVDSMIDNNYVDLNKIITKKYDIPILMEEKEKVIYQLESKLIKNEKTHTSYIFILVIFLLCLIIYSSFLFFQNKKNKKKFEELMNAKEVKPVAINNTTSTLNISEDIISDLLQKIEKFEEKKEYQKQDLTINKLAKKFNTNEKYLSKIINSYKNKKFIQYINDLRIDNIIDELKSNDKLRLYTIKAIAAEAGFNTAQSFSSAFQKKTSIKPSYFIKQLNK